jgi:pyruvate dehydrogenase (quinone)
MGVRVEDPAQVRPARERALASSGPALLDVVTAPNILAMPPKATVQQAKGVCSGEDHDGVHGRAG